MNLVGLDPFRDLEEVAHAPEPILHPEDRRREGLLSDAERLPQIADAASDLDLAARLPVNVMVTAVNGADRVAWARAIHDRSAHCHGPFVAVHIRTGPGVGPAIRPRDVAGWFHQSAGGTLFIDHVAQLSLRAQGRLFSLLTEQLRHARSATKPSADHCVRVITGSNRSLRAEIAVGTFSDALFYRLNEIHIHPVERNESGEDTMKARDLMSKPPYTCGPDTDLAIVAKLMWDHDCGSVPVVDASGTVVGVVTDRDICIATATRRLLPEQIAASQVMTAPIRACLSNDSVSDVLATMREFRIRRVPVIDANGRLQGVISLNDIVLAATEKREPRASDVLSTMAAICAHRRETAVA